MRLIDSIIINAIEKNSKIKVYKPAVKSFINIIFENVKNLNHAFTSTKIFITTEYGEKCDYKKVMHILDEIFKEIPLIVACRILKENKIYSEFQYELVNNKNVTCDSEYFGYCYNPINKILWSTSKRRRNFWLKIYNEVIYMTCLVLTKKR